MGRRITDPTSIFQEITSDYQGVFGHDLVGITLYGSAAGPDFRPRTSDVNFLIVLSEEGMKHIDRALDIVAKWRRKGVALPLFLTEAYVAASLDVFPIEYLGLARNHRRVFGKDVLEGLRVKPAYLRLQCEREIKGKLLLLREAYLDCGGKGKALLKVIRDALPALVAIFGALLYLRGDAPPTGKREIIRAAAGAFGLDPGVFERMIEIREGTYRGGKGEVEALFKAFLNQMERLSKTIDAWGQEGCHG